MTSSPLASSPSAQAEQPATPRLDLEFVRAQFPALTRPDTANWAHFENAGGSYVPSQVIDLLTRFFTATKVQPYGPGGPSKEAGEAMDRAKALIPATFNARSDEVHFGPSTSQNTYVLARAVRGSLAIGDEIVVTNQDHEANIGAWRRLADGGIVIREWSVDPITGLLDLADLALLLSERTKLVCVTHASNLAATINPIPEIAELAHSYGALVLVDGVAWAPHAAVDVVALGCDFYLYSTYKTYGPHLGVMFSKREVTESLTNQGHFFNESNPTARLTPAGPDHAAVAASAGIVDYYDALYRHHFASPEQAEGSDRSGAGNASEPALVDRIASVFELVAEHEEALMTPMLDFLDAKGVRVIGSPEPWRDRRAPTVAFHANGVDHRTVVETLAGQNIGVGQGDFYARRLVDAMGLPGGVLRISMVHYNTVEEVQRCIDALDPLL